MVVLCFHISKVFTENLGSTPAGGRTPVQWLVAGANCWLPVAWWQFGFWGCSCCHNSEELNMAVGFGLFVLVGLFWSLAVHKLL